jgi:phosphoribosyl 1,2-cyclic phosphodiesterase
VAALVHLARHHAAELQRAGNDEARLRALVELHLPFHLRSTFGGHTTCVEVQTPDGLFIIDCGSGLRELGVALEKRWNDPGYRGPRAAHVFITHAHMDHTLATPFFDPYLDPRNQFSLYGSASVLRSLEAVLDPSSPLSNTYFPPTFDLLKALRNKHVIDGGRSLSFGRTTVATQQLRHPGGCLGYRFDCGGKRFVFCTDHEHQEVPDPQLAAFARDADLLYLDGQYLAEELDGRVGIMGEAPQARNGWGHSSVEACVATAVAARARLLHVGHREPKRDDNDLARVEQYLQRRLAQALAAAAREPGWCAGCIPFEGLSVCL